MDPQRKEKKAAYLREWRNRNRDYVRQKVRETYSTPEGFASHRNSRLKLAYGITLAEYEEMFSKQNGL